MIKNEHGFGNTHLKLNNKRDKVKLYSNKYLKENYEFDGVTYNFFPEPFTNALEGVTPAMAGEIYEVVEEGSNGTIIIIKTELGNITKPVGKWAIEELYTLEDNPEYYI